MTRDPAEPDPAPRLQTTYVPLEGDNFGRLAGYIEDELGIRMPMGKQVFLETRLLRRLRHHGLSDYNAYARMVLDRTDPEEVRHFIDAVTTNTTHFFRERDHFTVVEQVLLPRLKAQPGQEHHFWSAASSSGEEAYTLAMILADHASSHRGFAWRILGTDISGRVLERARQAVYDEEAIQAVSQRHREQYLLRGRGQASGFIRVSPALRERVIFRRLNLMDPDYPFRHPFAAIFCRNVLIYFDRRTQEAVLQRLCRHLAPGGMLFLGHAESIGGFNLPLKTVAPTAYRRT